jgi:site-specific recombinase XerD
MQGTPFSEEKEKIRIWLERQGYAEKTILENQRKLTQLIKWLSLKNKQTLEQLNNQLIKKYLKKLEKRLSPTTIRAHYGLIKMIDKYYQKMQNKKLLTQNIKIPKAENPKIEILTEQEISKLYKNTEDTILGYRDRVILGLYYGCGLRSSEGQNLKEEDINHTNKLIHIKKSKNHRNRYVPMSKKVQEDIIKYQKYSRPHLIQKNTNYLLLNQNTGKNLKGYTLRTRVQKLAKKANINKRVNLHQLRHSIASHLLQKGMEIEQIAQFLGHRDLASTQIYTHIKT